MNQNRANIMSIDRGMIASPDVGSFYQNSSYNFQFPNENSDFSNGLAPNSAFSTPNYHPRTSLNGEQNVGSSNENDHSIYNSSPQNQAYLSSFSTNSPFATAHQSNFITFNNNNNHIGYGPETSSNSTSAGGSVMVGNYIQNQNTIHGSSASLNNNNNRHNNINISSFHNNNYNNVNNNNILQLPYQTFHSLNNNNYNKAQSDVLVYQGESNNQFPIDSHHQKNPSNLSPHNPSIDDDDKPATECFLFSRSSPPRNNNNIALDVSQTGSNYSFISSSHANLCISSPTRDVSSNFIPPSSTPLPQAPDHSLLVTTRSPVTQRIPPSLTLRSGGMADRNKTFASFCSSSFSSSNPLSLPVTATIQSDTMATLKNLNRENFRLGKEQLKASLYHPPQVNLHFKGNNGLDDQTYRQSHSDDPNTSNNFLSTNNSRKNPMNSPTMNSLHSPHEQVRSSSHRSPRASPVSDSRHSPDISHPTSPSSGALSATIKTSNSSVDLRESRGGARSTDTSPANKSHRRTRTGSVSIISGGAGNDAEGRRASTASSTHQKFYPHSILKKSHIPSPVLEPPKPPKSSQGKIITMRIHREQPPSSFTIDGDSTSGSHVRKGSDRKK